MRERDPVHWSSLGAWIVTRYSDAQGLLHDSRLEHWKLDRDSLQREPRYFDHVLAAWLDLMDPRRHARLRADVSYILSPQAVAALRPEVEHLARRLLQQAEASGGLDAIGDFAEPLTLAVIGRLLGVPASDRERFKQLAHSMIGRLLGAIALSDEAAPSDEAALNLSAYLRELVDSKRGEPGMDIVSAMLYAKRAGDDITVHDYAALAIFFLFAGHENMMNLIGNSVLALLGHPEQLAVLNAKPPLISGALEELLRYDSPVQMIRLTAAADVHLRDKTIRAGEAVLVCVGSANRDPERFAEPDRLDLVRSQNRHLSFGGGVLRCIGAPLARLEGQVAIAALAPRLPFFQARLEAVTWRARPPVLRGPEALPLTVIR
jgi:cytochrome P450